MSSLLKIKDFVLSSDLMYFSFRPRDTRIEICLEMCAGGFCVSVFDLNQMMLEPRICTDDNGYLDSHAKLTGLRSVGTWQKALDIANKLYERYRTDPRFLNPEGLTR